MTAGTVRTQIVAHLLATLACMLALSTNLVRGAESKLAYDPLLIGQGSRLALEADPRFETRAELTIEMWIAAAKAQPDAKDGRDLCVVEHGDPETGIAWRVALSPKLDQISFSNGKGLSDARLSLDLADGAYHHIAVGVAGNRVQFSVDGSLAASISADGSPAPGSEAVLPPARQEGRPLVLGCSAGPSAKGWISSFRLWDRALSTEELRYAKEFAALVTGRPSLGQHLLAYGAFTTQAKEIRLPGPALRFTAMLGAEDGTPFFYRRPQDQSLAALYLLARKGIDGNVTSFSDLIAEYDGPQRQLQLQGNEQAAGKVDGGFAKLSLPTIYPTRSKDPSLEKAAYLRNIVEEAQRAIAGDPNAIGKEDLAFVQTAFLKARRQAREVQLGFTDQDGVSNFPENAKGELTYTPIRFSPAHGDGILRVLGRYDGVRIKNLRFETTAGIAVPALNKTVGAAGALDDIFRLELPEGARFEGITGRIDESGLRAIGLAYSLPTAAAPDATASSVPDGVWVDAIAPEPKRLQMLVPPDAPASGANAPASYDGTYERQKSYAFAYDPITRRLSLAISPDDKGGPLELLTFVRANGHVWREAIPENFKGDAWEGRGLYMHGARIRLASVGANEVWLERPRPYPESLDDKLPWGATFSLEHRPNGVAANFRGYFPYYMLANDLQATTGAAKMIFSMPDDTSKDYITTDSKLIIPHGLVFRYDNKGADRVDSHEIHSAEERQSAWGLQLGIKAGIPKLAKFSEDVEYKRGQEAASDSSTSLLLHRSTVTHYGLALDMGRIRLDDDFRASIVAIRDRMVMGAPIYWSEFFHAFGTHYANAVTYGGTAWGETAVDKSNVSAGNSEEIKAKLSAEANFGKFLEAGATVGGEASSQSKSSGGVENEYTDFGTYGGSFSRGGGWSVGRGEEVPLLLDLRPLPDLLVPAFFDDPVIHGQLRTTMQAELDRLESALAEQTRRKNSWASDVRLDNEVAR